MKKWNIKEQLGSEDHTPDKIIETLLKMRGIATKKEKELFFHPKNPCDLTADDVQIHKTALKNVLLRIEKAIQEKESIVVYADYDADGITAGAILWETLYTLDAHVMPYIPDRKDEGYGFSKKGLDRVKEEFNPTLIISVDHGITARDEVEYAKSLGMEIIVTDHHMKPDVVPDCLTLHTTELCGAGISYFLAKELIHNVILRNHETLPAGRQESIRYNDGTIHQFASDLLPLAAIGTIADMVPLVGPNRSITKYGLEALRTTHKVGLVALMEQAGIAKESVTTYSISHIIAPRLNAMGRLTHALDALRLLCTKKKDRAKELAGVLGSTNIERQQLTSDSILHAKGEVEKMYGKEITKKILIISHASYNPGIIGLVAGKLTEEHHRPTIVIAIGESISKASARSISGFNIVEAIRSSRELLIDVGGHPLAAGFTIETKHIAVFQEKLEQYAETFITDDMLERTVSIDLEVPLPSVTENLWEKLKSFEPYGLGNPEPVFATKGVIISNLRRIGAEGKHLKFQVENSLDAVAFNQSDFYPFAQSGNPVDIAYTIDMNEWNGKRKMQLKIKDILLT